MKNFVEFLNFCANFLINFSKVYKSLMSTFLLNVSPIRNFGDAIAVQDLSGIHVWNFVRCFPEPKSWRSPGFSSWYYDFSRWSYWHFCIQFCSSIKFYSVIFYGIFFCIFYGILYLTTFKKLGSPSAKSWSRYCLT